MMITHEARGMHRWVHKTYRIGPQVKDWCQRLADSALPPDSSFDFSKLWDEAGEIASNPDEVHIAKAVAKIGWDLYRRIRDQLSQRSKGIAVLAASDVFEASVGGQEVDVEVTAVYEVDPSAGTVAFLFFDTCTPSSRQSVAKPDRPGAVALTEHSRKDAECD
jgi:hypothetical protein